MRHDDISERGRHLDEVRRQVNESRATTDDYRRSPGRRRHDDFGPPWGFASLGDLYGQNIDGFWPRR